MNEVIKRSMIERYKEEAEDMGLTLEEYLLFLILQKLDDLSVTAYPPEY